MLDVFMVDGGWGYRVVDESKHINIEQPFFPHFDGFLKMTKLEADVLGRMVDAGIEPYLRRLIISPQAAAGAVGDVVTITVSVETALPLREIAGTISFVPDEALNTTATVSVDAFGIRETVDIINGISEFDFVSDMPGVYAIRVMVPGAKEALIEVTVNE